MIVPVMAISNLVLTQQLIYSEETNGAHAHYREPVPLTVVSLVIQTNEGKVNYMMRTQIAKNQLLFRHLKRALLCFKKKRLNPEQKLNGGREATTGNASAVRRLQMPLICNIKLHPPAPSLFFARLSYYETANNSQGFQWVIVLFV